MVCSTDGMGGSTDGDLGRFSLGVSTLYCLVLEVVQCSANLKRKQDSGLCILKRKGCLE